MKLKRKEWHDWLELRGGTRAIATRRMNRLDEILAQELTTETKLELAALCDVFKKLRQTLDDMNSDVQGLIGVDEIDADMMTSNDYDVKLAVAIQVQFLATSCLAQSKQRAKDRQ